jgi:hypothetical protein
MDFAKYKASLKKYLTIKGFNVSNNPMLCFSPSHQNTNTPACMIYDENFSCASCGIHGDIYDACEVLTGINDRAEQFAEVEKTLGGSSNFKTEPTEPKQEKFIIDENALLKLIDYLKNYGGREKGIRAFLKQRGYIDEIAEKMLPYFVYWPGFDVAIKEAGKTILKASGIPLLNPVKKVSSWNSPGAIVRLAKGLKLCFYQTNSEGKNICEKRGSKGCYTFPGPSKINDSQPVILVEAEITSIAMRALGYENVFPTGGTKALTIHALKEYLLNVPEIIFAFDGDEPGRVSSGLQKNTENKFKSYPRILVEIGYQGTIKLAELPDGKDPDDLIRANKIDELKKIIDSAKVFNKKIKSEEPEKNELPFFFLGYDEKSYYILPKDQQISIRIARGDNTLKNWIREIASNSWWMNNFYEVDDEGNQKFAMSKALEWFRQESKRNGIYNDEKILGLGVHEDSGKIVFNMGDSLMVDGKKIEYTEYSGINTYCRSKIKLSLNGKTWTIKDGQNLVKQVKTFNFERGIDYIAVLGYIALAPFASILEVRPHIWITSQKGAGKTTIIKKIIVPGVGKKQAFFKEALISEAYLRQTCGKDCRVPVIDEFEAHDMDSRNSQKKLLTLMRSAYSGTGTGKGTSDHRPVDFNVRMMFCVASINIRFDNDGDRTRVVVCRLKQKEKKDCNYVEQIENFDGLRLRILKKIHKVNQYIESARNIMLAAGHDNRAADTYSPFLVGFWMIISDNDFFEDDQPAKDCIERAIKNLSEPDYKDDEDKIIERILQERIRIDSSKEYSIAEMLTLREMDTGTGFEKNLYDNEIRRYGLRRFVSNNNEVLAIDIDHPELKKILRDTPFQDYKEILQRHAFVTEKSKVVYMSGKNTRCIIFSWEKLYEKYFCEKSEDDKPF